MCEQLRRTYEEKVREDPKDGKVRERSGSEITRNLSAAGRSRHLLYLPHFRPSQAYLALGQVLMELGSMHQDEDALIMTKDVRNAEFSFFHCFACLFDLQVNRKIHCASSSHPRSSSLYHT